MNDIIFSSSFMEWETPQELFDKVNKEFNFDIDVCASAENTKCSKYYSIQDNGLEQVWSGVCWCNPPYGREIIKWVKKAYESSLEGAVVVMLIPARTDTKWFHQYVYGKAELRFIKGRIKFKKNGKVLNSSTFPSMLVIFNKKGSL